MGGGMEQWIWNFCLPPFFLVLLAFLLLHIPNLQASPNHKAHLGTPLCTSKTTKDATVTRCRGCGVRRLFVIAVLRELLDLGVTAEAAAAGNQVGDVGLGSGYR